MGVKVDSLIFQISAEADRTEQERTLAADGLLPVAVFANGPENAFLLGVRPTDLDAAFDAARERADGLGAERLAWRMRVFDGLGFAIESDMKYLVDPSDFPNDSVLLMAEAFYQAGFDEAAQLRPCAARFARDRLDEPDFELAPDAESGTGPGA